MLLVKLNKKVFIRGKFKLREKQKNNSTKQNMIFFDSHGSRWTKTKRTLSFLLAISIVLSTFYWLNFLFSTSSSFDQNNTEKTTDLGFSRKLAYSTGMDNLKAVGEGHMYQVVAIKDGSFIDIYSEKEIRKLSEKELNIVGADEYAVLRYQKTPGKYLAITFDDGPDPVFTPQILDILAREKVQATFFVTGKNVVRYPEITKRIVREGHMLANHTFSHVDFDNISSIDGRKEILETDRIIRAVTGTRSDYFRLPYVGADDETILKNIRGSLQAQQLGFRLASYTYDTNDWDVKEPLLQKGMQLDNKGQVILMHDSGGDRTNSVKYLEMLIVKAKKENYTFHTMSQLTDSPQEHYSKQKANFLDYVTLTLANVIYVWPDKLMYILFVISVAMIVVSTLLNVILTILNRNKIRKSSSSGYKPFVSVIIAAFNEELVIQKTIESVMESKHRKLEVVVVNDGSTDKTAEILSFLQSKYSSKLKVINQQNAGKSAALNHALIHASGEILIAIDADTIFLKDTISNLSRHFISKEIGAVAGFVKVGNKKNILTRWQSLEYISGISFERFAHSYLGRMMIVPGACAAWRKTAVVAAGGYSSSTLAEDCDLTLAIQKCGYKAITDLDAIAMTEVPKTIKDLLKQRFRWMFGNLQVFWKHRDMIFNRKYGLLGLYAMPLSVISVIIPIVFLPFVYLVLINNIINRDFEIIFIFFGVIVAIQFVIAAFSIWLVKEKYSNLWIIPIYRFIYEPLRIFLLYKSVLTILRGNNVGWNKVKRLGEVRI